MKPSDLFLSVIDFFSTVVPGAIATFFLTTPMWSHILDRWPDLKRESTEFWAGFFVVAYILGHFISAVGNLALDRIYDRLYAPWRRVTSEFAKSKLPTQTSRWRVLWTRIRYVVKDLNPDDELLAIAKEIKRDQLGEIARRTKINPDNITNTFWWSGTVVRMKAPAGAAEIDGLSAQSKLFRGVAVIVPIAAVCTGSFHITAILAWAAILALALWRFMALRWAATERTYEYFIAVSVIPTGSRKRGTAAS